MSNLGFWGFSLANILKMASVRCVPFYKTQGQFDPLWDNDPLLNVRFLDLYYNAIISLVQPVPTHPQTLQRERWTVTCVRFRAKRTMEPNGTVLTPKFDHNVGNEVNDKTKQHKRRVAYIFSNEYLAVCNELPKVKGRVRDLFIWAIIGVMHVFECVKHLC